MPKMTRATHDEAALYREYCARLKVFRLTPRSLEDWVKHYRSVNGRPTQEPKPLAQGKVRCPACGHIQEDRGKRATCDGCGIQPMPSAAYPKTCCFSPAYAR